MTRRSGAVDPLRGQGALLRMQRASSPPSERPIPARGRGTSTDEGRPRAGGASEPRRRPPGDVHPFDALGIDELARPTAAPRPDRSRTRGRPAAEQVEVTGNRANGTESAWHVAPFVLVGLACGHRRGGPRSAAVRRARRRRSPGWPRTDPRQDEREAPASERPTTAQAACGVTGERRDGHWGTSHRCERVSASERAANNCAGSMRCGRGTP